MDDSKRYQELVDTLEDKALEGDIQALHYLGDVLYQGVSKTEKNTALAFPYWKRAVDNGDVSIAHKVAFALFSGDAGYKDHEEALRYFIIAAENGNVDAAHAAGLCYEHGFGCDVDIDTAKEYYEYAALQNHGEAQWRLGSLKFINQESGGLHWICCAHLSGVQKATDSLNQMIENDNGALDIINRRIERIQQNGLDPNAGSEIVEDNSSEGCYIATAVYGSYDCPQVWTLRRFRDNTLGSTWYGRAFIRTYYAISPTIVKWFGNTQWFKQLWKNKLDKMVSKLRSNGVEDTPYQDKNW